VGPREARPDGVEPGISRFRVWSSGRQLPTEGPSRNDVFWIARALFRNGEGRYPAFFARISSANRLNK
jgi:hypothetical protein